MSKTKIEKEVLFLIKEYQENKDKEIRNLLFKRMYRTLRYDLDLMVKKKTLDFRKAIIKSELTQTLCLCLERGMRKFRGNTKPRFIKMIDVSFNNAIIDSIRKKNLEPETVNISFIEEDLYNIGAFHNDIAVDSSLLLDFYHFDKHLDKLKPKNRKIVEDKILFNKTYDDIALELDTSKQAVSQRYKRIIERLRELLTEGEKNGADI